MMCEECGKEEATVHIEKVVNGRKITMHLCRECAKRSGLLTLNVLFQPSFSINNLLSAFLGSQTEIPPTLERGIGEPRCPVCGMTYKDFARVGRLGCSKCYEVFGERLRPLLRRIHGLDSHVGKVPSAMGEVTQIRRQLEQLRRQLTEAVSTEEYEKAAKLRDRIKQFEAKLGGS
jgi:protein arginine kinase activator